VSRVLVTGAAGFIGSHVAETLLARGHDVIGVDNFDPFYPRAVKEENLAACRACEGFTLVEADVRDGAHLATLLSPETAVIHLAALAGVRPSMEDPLRYADVNVGGTAALLAAMRDVGATRLVFASSSSVYGDTTPVPFREDAPAATPVSPYGATKRAAELLIGSLAAPLGLRAAMLRLFTVFGARQRPDLAIHAFARRMADGRPVTLFGSGQARDYTYIADAVAGILAGLAWTSGAPGGTAEPFNIGGSEAIPLDTMTATLAAALGVTPELEHLPMQPGDVRWTAADLTRSAEVLHYAPRTSFALGIERFVTWFREAHALAN